MQQRMASEQTQKRDGVHKTWDFTLFYNAADEMEDLLIKMRLWATDCTRLQVAQELCPDTNRAHLQCKLTWKVGKRWAAMKKLMGDAHFEISITTCYAYCAKLDSKILIAHDTREPGARSDLQKMKKCIDEGGTQEALWHEHFGSMMRYHNGIEKYRAIINKKRKRPHLQVQWILGASGIGKSKKANADNPDAYWLNMDGTGNIWWDGYDGEDTVIIDDFRPNMFTYEQLLKLLSSQGKYRIAIKGGSGWLTCSKIVLTSVEHPNNMYSMYDEQLARRVTEWTYLD